MDAAERVASVAARAKSAQRGLADYRYMDLALAQEDIQAGRRSAPMLATQEQGHVSYWRKVTEGTAEKQAVALQF